MLEKIRLAVDLETKKIIDDISQGIEDRLSKKPSWSSIFLEEIIEQLEKKAAARPEWAGTLEKSLQSVEKESAKAGNELQKLKAHVESFVPRLDQTDTAVSEVHNMLNVIKTTVDLTKSDFSNGISEVNVLLYKIKADNDKMREGTSHDLSLLQTRIAEQQTMIETLVGAIQEQSIQMTRCEQQLETIMKPWWKKLFRRVIC